MCLPIAQTGREHSARTSVYESRQEAVKAQLVSRGQNAAHEAKRGHFSEFLVPLSPKKGADLAVLCDN